MSLFEDVLASVTADAEATAGVPDPLGFGVDFDCADDLTELMELASGPRALAQAVYRRLTTPRGALLDAPDYGYDLRELLSRGMTSADLAAIPGIIRSEVTKDERIFDVTTRVSRPAPDTLELSVHCTTAEGPFTLVLKVTAETVALLEVRS
ncbi:hypothetical protein [Sorangium sp. So ce117]|uniref:hypothetical protein n=1 Tax=Sorangium sp. So ce117 TaxID=3133277 RepID=UPI003F61BB13